MRHWWPETKCSKSWETKTSPNKPKKQRSRGLPFKSKGAASLSLKMNCPPIYKVAQKASNKSCRRVSFHQRRWGKLSYCSEIMGLTISKLKRTMEVLIFGTGPSMIWFGSTMVSEKTLWSILTSTEVGHFVDARGYKFIADSASKNKDH